jgi:hypothetical protein
VDNWATHARTYTVVNAMPKIKSITFAVARTFGYHPLLACFVQVHFFLTMVVLAVSLDDRFLTDGFFVTLKRWRGR